MTTVRNILTEALARANLVPRKRAVPADMLENAFQLFKGILQKYNFSNFIIYTRDELDLIPVEEKVVLDSEEINSITGVSYKTKSSIDYNALRFVSWEQFHTDPDVFTYTWKYGTDGNIELYFRKQFIDYSKAVKVLYNKKLEYSLDDELKVPDIYKELYTVALTYKLALTYPRTDASQVAILKGELEEVEKQVNALVSSNKILTRDTVAVSNMSAFLSGSFLGI